MSANGTPLLSDFGISRLQYDGKTITGTKTFRLTVRWIAPELIDESNDSTSHQMHTKETDVWAFGMVTYVRCTY